jgi:hypothetical protein
MTRTTTTTASSFCETSSCFAIDRGGFYVIFVTHDPNYWYCVPRFQRLTWINGRVLLLEIRNGVQFGIANS